MYNGALAGIGVDLCSVVRMQKALARESFMRRVYTQRERDYLASRGKGSAQSAAAMFAAKEAVAKALGTGMSGGVCFEQIEVTHDAKGAPSVCLWGAALERLHGVGGGRVLLSLSHEGEMAIAFAVIEAGGDLP